MNFELQSRHQTNLVLNYSSRTSMTETKDGVIVFGQPNQILAAI